MTDLTQHDELIAGRTLDRLATGWAPHTGQAGPLDDDEREVLAHLEALALFAYAAAPEEPSQDVRAGLLARIADEPLAAPPKVAPSPERPPLEEQAIGDAIDVLQRDPVDRTLQIQTADSDSSVDMTLQHARMVDLDAGDMTLVGLGGHSLAATEPEAVPPRAANRSRGPILALAAALVLALVGLGYLYGQLQAASSEADRAARTEAELRLARDQVTVLRDRLHMITTVARNAYPMQPAVATPDGAASTADGVVWVCGHHQQWYLALSGLEQPPPGKAYHIWFKTRNGEVDGGVIDVQPDGTADLEDLTMPEGTHGFVVSLETVRSAFDQPSGRIILVGDEAVQL